MNNKHCFLFRVKNISSVQLSSCHTSDENFLTPNFSQTTVVHNPLVVVTSILMNLAYNLYKII